MFPKLNRGAVTIINANGVLVCAGKGSPPKTIGPPEAYRSGRKENIFATVALLNGCVALLNVSLYWFIITAFNSRRDFFC